MNGLVRCFLAVEVPSSSRDRLNAWLAPMRKKMPSLRWVAPSLWHVTLRFCGELDAGRLERLERELASWHEKNATPRFGLSLERLGAFPNLKRPRVITAELGGDVKSLRELQGALEQSVRQSGLAAETRPFSPHLTLARVREPGDLPSGWPDLVAGGAEAFPKEAWTASEVILMRSFLHRGGPEYAPLVRYNLIESI